MAIPSLFICSLPTDHRQPWTIGSVTPVFASPDAGSAPKPARRGSDSPGEDLIAEARQIPQRVESWNTDFFRVAAWLPLHTAHPRSERDAGDLLKVVDSLPTSDLLAERHSL